MIRMIRGTVIARGKSSLVIDVGGAAGGLGLKVAVPEPAAVAAHINAPITLHTYLQVREDALNLYGFLSEDELSLFELRCSSQRRRRQASPLRVSTLSPDAFRLALANQEPALIARVRHRQADRRKDRPRTERQGGTCGRSRVKFRRRHRRRRRSDRRCSCSATASSKRSAPSSASPKTSKAWRSACVWPQPVQPLAAAQNL